MSYIGSTPTTQSFIAGTDYFNGTGSAVNFTLSRSVNSVNDIEVIVNNVEQIPSGYSVSGTTLTFSAAPSSGTSNVYVRYLSTTILSVVAGNVTPTAVSDQLNLSTGYFGLPAGTTAQRPGISANGMLRYNTTIGKPEWYSATNSAWIPFDASPTYLAEYLLVAGAGGGGAPFSGGGGGGGGGAGGMLTGSSTLLVGTTYSFTVGGGGAGGIYNGSTSRSGSNGTNSTAFSLTSTGGGYGGGVDNGGGAGGSGGGAGTYGGGNLPGGNGTAGQGNNGGSNGGSSPAGGGGGKGSAGASGSAGSGAASSITGSSVTYAAGGANTSGGVGGANTGNGGGGNTSGGSGGAGGSGVVIISVPTANYSGTTTGSPTVTTSGSNTIIKFTASGSYTA